MRSAIEYFDYHKQKGLHTLAAHEFSIDENPEVMEGIRLSIAHTMKHGHRNPLNIKNELGRIEWMKRHDFWRFVRVFYGGSASKAMEHAMGNPYEPDFASMYERYVRLQQRIPNGFWDIIPMESVVAILRTILFEVERLTPAEVFKMRYMQPFKNIISKHRLGGVICGRFNNVLTRMIAVVIPYETWTEGMLEETYNSRSWPQGFWQEERNPKCKEMATWLVRHWFEDHPTYSYMHGKDRYIVADESVLRQSGFTGPLLVYGSRVEALIKAAYPNENVQVIDMSYMRVMQAGEEAWRKGADAVLEGRQQRLSYGMISNRNPMQKQIVTAIIIHLFNRAYHLTPQQLLSKSDPEIRKLIADSGFSTIPKQISLSKIREWLTDYVQGRSIDMEEKLKLELVSAWKAIQEGERKQFPYGILRRHPEYTEALSRFMVEKFLVPDAKLTSKHLVALTPSSFNRSIRKYKCGPLLSVATRTQILDWIRDCERAQSNKIA